MARGINIIAAISENGVIGRDGMIPWHVGADLKRFRALTWGHVIIMGRRTHASIGRPLPGRRSIVLSTQPDFTPKGVEVATNLKAAIKLAGTDATIFLVGGAAVYRAGLEIANTMHLTRIHAEVNGDVQFPPFDQSQWRCVQREWHDPEGDGAFAFTFERYEKRTD